MLAGWRARVAAEAPSHLRSHPHEIMVTLLAAYLYCRHREITDALADLLIATVHRINARADTKVTSDFVAELKRVSGKENILFKMTEAAMKSPGERVEDVIYPAVPGGHETLVALLHEFKAKGTSYRQHRQPVFKASYTSHYRTGLIQIIEVLEFGSTNTVHAPVVEALALIKRYKADVPSRVKCYAPGEHVPVEGIVPAELVELMYRADSKRRQRMLRTVYECGVFQSLREKLRCKEIWVAGAEKWRNPDLDLPADFEAHRAENYAQLRKPLGPRRFTGELREELDAEMSALNDALGGKGLAWLKIAERRNAGAIHLTPLDAAPEPRNLRRMKTAIRARWGVVPLMDMLTETCLRTGCLDVFTPAGTQNHLDPQVLFERLLLLIYAYSTRTGIRAAAAGDHPHTEDDLRYARRRYLTVEASRQAARIIANATFASRQAALWGEGTTAVASHSTHFSAFDQNIYTEWHSRYRRARRGVLIYWTVDVAGSMTVHSQLISCSASEVHAMVEGAMRHGTDMEIEQNFVDSHGASFVGFGITRLLDFDLIARFKQINTMKLYVPAAATSTPTPARAGADPPDPLGRHREQLRPDDEVRHRDPAAHRLHRGAAAPLHLRDHPPGLRRDARGRARPARHLPGPLARRPRPAARDRVRAERGGELQRRQRLHPLRQARRARLQPARGAGARDAVPAHPAEQPRPDQHPHDPGHPRAARMGGRTHRR